jgi:phage terminase large subunit GpA-like protein
MRPRITLVDSGDEADAVYDYVMPRQNLRDCVFAVKGVPYHAKPVMVQEGTTKRHNVRLFTVSTHAAKDRIFARLKLAAHGPGHLHFPSWCTEEFFKQLTSERKAPIKNKRTGVRKLVWIKTHTRNEALDLEVYALAGLWILQNILDPVQFRDLDRLARALAGEMPMPSAPRRRVRSRGVAA